MLARPFRYPGSIFTCLLSAYVIARISILKESRIRLWWDAFSYAYRDSPEWDRGPLVSFIGHAPRLWGVPLFYALFPSDPPRLVAQWAVSTAAWALLAWTLWKCLRSLPAKVIASGAVLGFALLTPITQWDFTILSESLSISLGVIVVACFMLWARSGSRVALVALAATGFYWTFVRPELRLFVVVLCGVLLFDAWRRRDQRRWALGGAVVLAIAIGWSSLIMPTVYHNFGRYTHSHLSAQGDVLMFKLPYVYSHPELTRVYEQELGMPPCPAATALVRNRAGDFFELLAEYNACPELSAWGDKHGSEPIGFLVAAPDLAARAIWRAAPHAFGGVDGYGYYGISANFFPKRIDRLSFHPTMKVLGGLLGGLLVALIVAVVSGAFRRRRLLVGTALVLIATALVSEVIGILLLDAEPARYGIQENIALRIALLVLVVATIDTVAERLRERSAQRAQVEAPSEVAPVSPVPLDPSDHAEVPVGAIASATSRGGGGAA
ncbi:MAG: hypothetical protein ACM30G_08465 [Micromonosporaceae bacterium]